MSRDSVSKYTVWRASSPEDALDYVVGEERPDLIVVIVADARVLLASAASRTQIPLLMRLQDVEFHRHTGPLADLGNLPCVANSQYKGRDIALGVARLCPEIPFTFVEPWRLYGEHRLQPMESLAPLRNVTLLPPQDDMREVYRSARFFLRRPCGRKPMDA